MKIRIELSEHDLKLLVQRHIEDQTGKPLKTNDLKIEVKSKQNFKSEWEEATFRAVYDNAQ